MVEIALPRFVAVPAAPPPWPGVVVVHEGNGMSPQLLRVCQRLAREGYATLAPDLFWRHGGTNPDNYAEILGSIQLADVRAALATAVADLRSRGASSVGMTGFCMGGGYTYLAATSGIGVDAAAPF